MQQQPIETQQEYAAAAINNRKMQQQKLFGKAKQQ